VKLVVFGATGGTGAQIVARALEAGHDVTAFARDPANVKLAHERLRVARGDATVADDVARAVAGHDAALSSIGPRPGTKPGTLISDATRNIVAACTQTGTRRFVFESGLMVGDGRALGFWSRIGVRIFRAMNRALYEDKVRAESLIRESSLDWVIVRPPTLVHQPAKGGYLAGPDQRVRASRSMSHADAADAMLRALGEPEWIRKAIEVGY